MILEHHLLTKIIYHYYLLGHQNLKHRYDHSYNHIHVSGIQPPAAPPTKCSRGKLKDPTGTAEKKAQATQQHLGRLGKLASLAKKAFTKTTGEIMFVWHNSVADSSAW